MGVVLSMFLKDIVGIGIVGIGVRIGVYNKRAKGALGSPYI